MTQYATASATSSQTSSLSTTPSQSRSQTATGSPSPSQGVTPSMSSTVTTSQIPSLSLTSTSTPSSSQSPPSIEIGARTAGGLLSGPNAGPAIGGIAAAAAVLALLACCVAVLLYRRRAKKQSSVVWKSTDNRQTAAPAYGSGGGAGMSLIYRNPASVAKAHAAARLAAQLRAAQDAAVAEDATDDRWEVPDASNDRWGEGVSTRVNPLTGRSQRPRLEPSTMRAAASQAGLPSSPISPSGGPTSATGYSSATATAPRTPKRTTLGAPPTPRTAPSPQLSSTQASVGQDAASLSQLLRQYQLRQGTSVRRPPASSTGVTTTGAGDVSSNPIFSRHRPPSRGASSRDGGGSPRHRRRRRQSDEVSYSAPPPVLAALGGAIGAAAATEASGMDTELRFASNPLWQQQQQVAQQTMPTHRGGGSALRVQVQASSKRVQPAATSPVLSGVRSPASTALMRPRGSLVGRVDSAHDTSNTRGAPPLPRVPQPPPARRAVAHNANSATGGLMLPLPLPPPAAESTISRSVTVPVSNGEQRFNITNPLRPSVSQVSTAPAPVVLRPQPQQLLSSTLSPSPSRRRIVPPRPALTASVANTLLPVQLSSATPASATRAQATGSALPVSAWGAVEPAPPAATAIGPTNIQSSAGNPSSASSVSDRGEIAAETAATEYTNPMLTGGNGPSKQLAQSQASPSSARLRVTLLRPVPPPLHVVAATAVSPPTAGARESLSSLEDPAAVTDPGTPRVQLSGAWRAAPGPSVSVAPLVSSTSSQHLSNNSLSTAVGVSGQARLQVTRYDVSH